MANIAIIGAGITGVTSAYALMKRGHQVEVIDSNRYAAMETSFANGGQLSASNAEVWNNWGTIRKGLNWMLRANAPLLLNPRPSWHKYSWLAEFCGQIGSYAENTIATTRLAIKAREELFSIADQHGIDFDFANRGILHIYHDQRGFEDGAAANHLLKQGGLERHAVTPEEIAQIEPTLHGDFHGGFFTPSDSTGDIHKFTRGLAEVCRSMGARFRYQRKVSAIQSRRGTVAITLDDVCSGETEMMQVDAVVICAGVGSRRLAAMVGDRINIYPVKGYSITVNLNDDTSRAAAPSVSILDERAKIVTSRLGPDRFRIAGTAEFNGFNKDIRSDRIAPLVDWAETTFPPMSTSSVVPWAGLRPMTPSMLPRVGAGACEGIYYNTGHGHLGWTLSGATAEILAESVSSQMRVAGAA